MAATLPGASGTLCCPLVARASPLWDDHGRLRDLQVTWLRQPLLGRGRVDHDPGCSYCAHGPGCYRCPPSRGRSTVCRDCRAEILRAEIAADPLYGGGSAWGDGR
ncbi:hypothetical protein ACIG5E_34255 [Kitasatospora sp. NPDC053057]|uniref:hypothetical protein n=1 Tax=Kitasatospora sp. NPDC053057 TaxID=3364062 RepID=UPI0037C5FC5F